MTEVKNSLEGSRRGCGDSKLMADVGRIMSALKGGKPIPEDLIREYDGRGDVIVSAMRIIEYEESIGPIDWDRIDIIDIFVQDSMRGLRYPGERRSTDHKRNLRVQQEMFERLVDGAQGVD